MKAIAMLNRIKDECENCMFFKNDRCTHNPKGIFLPCKYFVRKMTEEDIRLLTLSKGWDKK